jgi:hypothetical protein
VEHVVGVLYLRHASSWSEHVVMTGGDPTRFFCQLNTECMAEKRCTLVAQPEHSLAVCVRDTVLPHLFFSNSGETLIVHGLRLTFHIILVHAFSKLFITVDLIR